ncbi:PaaI family thioesterase [Salinibacillus xinjiangensis]|uniref:Hotdog fold thioesterase n=1 Tax=Salinibacillus xinjiangensis TaxID=1229268 RepID=A0A6G1X1R4_9BACI|nr:PaaI family thioesterase [Salinibacillus xinjiangensis]MRG84825.1 hotdog fold thioesterase [Salinibacillus xinjiangensis]
MGVNQTRTCETRQQSIKQIEQRLHHCSEQELSILEHTINALEQTSSMHLIGRFLGIKQVDNQMIMKLGPQNENIYGVAQGGAVYTLADVAIGFHIKERLPENKQVYTLELKVNFLKKGEGEKLIAKPKIVQWGGRIVVSECSVYNEDNEVVAQALGTFYVKKIRNQESGEDYK